MKTIDGYEAIKGHNYFLENGQSVILDGGAVSLGTNKSSFLVTPLYEGETMSCSGAGGYHSEITMDYEHEGMQTLVDAIFEKVPLEKVDQQYKDKLSEIEKLSLSFGELKNQTNKLLSVKSLIEKEIKNAVRSSELASKKENEEREFLDIIKVNVSKKRQELSELEDSITGLKNEDVSDLISKTELQRLNKRDFELQCLENGGIDNWEWYSESLKDFKKRYPED